MLSDKPHGKGMRDRKIMPVADTRMGLQDREERASCLCWEPSKAHGHLHLCHRWAGTVPSMLSGALLGASCH